MFFQEIPVNYSKKCSASIQNVLIGQIKVIEYTFTPNKSI